jgi:hypothetical protein
LDEEMPALAGAQASMRPDYVSPRRTLDVARHLVVLDRLRGGDQRGIHHRLVGDLADDVVGFSGFRLPSVNGGTAPAAPGAASDDQCSGAICNFCQLSDATP